jgi:hypothetical protein
LRRPDWVGFGHWHHSRVGPNRPCRKVTDRCSVGDVLDTLMAIMVIGTCQQIEGGLPTSVKLRMYLNIVLDFIIGLIPIIGDVADALFRANIRNAIILEEHLQENGSKNA